MLQDWHWTPTIDARMLHRVPHLLMTPSATVASTLAAYRRAAVRHRDDHGCGGYPFEDGQRLTDLVTELDATTVLELGTAIGFSAFCFASAADRVRVDTIDRDAEHVALARGHLQQHGADGRVAVHEGDFATVLARLTGPYDLIFVDGFGADPALLPRLDELATGAIVSANLSWSSGAREYLDAMAARGWTSVRERDIAISRRSR